MNWLLHAALLVSVVTLAVTVPGIARRDPGRWRLFRYWLLIGFAGMVVCAFFGGAVSEPMYRYQGRIIWIVPLMAGVAALIRLQLRKEIAEPAAIGS